MFNDGSGTASLGVAHDNAHKYLIDVSEGLSELYGRLIRQGQVFSIKSVEARIFNPGTTTQDENIVLAGKFIYAHPTGNRKKAWRTALTTWIRNRRALGIRSRNSDFRVGLSEDYSTDVGIFGEGVKFNSWINADDDPLLLFGGNDNQAIFRNHNRNMSIDLHAQPVNPSDGFGHWAQKDADSLGDELDFVTAENSYFTLGEASEVAQTVPFMVGLGAWSDDSQSDPNDFAFATNVHRSEDIPAMCGLLGIYIDTSTVDDSESGTAQDYGIEITVDIESWSPL